MEFQFSSTSASFPRFAVCCLLLVLMSGMHGCGSEDGAERSRTLTVAVAANAVPLMEQIVRRFEQEHPGVVVQLSAGSSGLLARQISQGAPFDLFISADTASVERLVAGGSVAADSVRSYALGRLVLVFAEAPDPAPTSTASAVEALGRVSRFALANPEHAPYGTAAKEALLALGSWEALEPAAVFGENVMQASQFLETGNVDAAFLPCSLLARHEGKSWIEVDGALHRPIQQSLGIPTHAAEPELARAFAETLLSPQGRAMVEASGFRAPDETE